MKTVVTDKFFGSAELFSQTSTAQMTELFLYYIQCQWNAFIFLFCLMIHMYLSGVISGL
jgi:hypothetical protein